MLSLDDVQPAYIQVIKIITPSVVERSECLRFFWLTTGILARKPGVSEELTCLVNFLNILTNLSHLSLAMIPRIAESILTCRVEKLGHCMLEEYRRGIFSQQKCH